ncbi:MAG: tetratricopeptide repeat protein, partial [Chitinophagales bacterium]
LQAEKEQDKSAVKHNAARELATAYLAVGDYKNALQFAQSDLDMRPKNIDANALIAWIYYKMKDYDKAKMHVANMFSTNVKNNNYLYKASLIYDAAGDKEMAAKYLQEAKAVSPYFDKMIAVR